MGTAEGAKDAEGGGDDDRDGTAEDTPPSYRLTTAAVFRPVPFIHPTLQNRDASLVQPLIPKLDPLKLLGNPFAHRFAPSAGMAVNEMTLPPAQSHAADPPHSKILQASCV